MIERVIEYSIRNRFLVLAVAAGLTAWGIYAVLRTPVDAIPDLSENQVIVFTDWMGRSPREIEDQITYPLSLKLQGLAGVKTVRSSSEFNFSMITIIFEDDVDFYFARQRVLEKLTLAMTFLPSGVTPYLAPDATALGQIFWYTVEGGGLDSARLWALNKYYIAPQLNSAAGVAEVATVGGAPLEYQVDVRPEALRAYGLTLGEFYEAVARSNLAVGGRVIQKNNAEYLVRGVGWIKDKTDIENTVIRANEGTPVYVKNLAVVQLGTQFRRSVFEKDGNEVAGGVVMMRYGGNPLEVTRRVREKIQELQPGLPAGVRILPAYDRTRLVSGAINTLRRAMLEEMIIAAVAVFLILWHVRSAFVICVTLPLAVLFSFLLMWLLRRLGVVDIQANIMSLAGITISIGILVDQAIVMTENATHHLKEHFKDRKVTGDIRELVIPACRTVGRPIFFSVMIMLISFIPVFALSGREGKLFHPLAFTKSFALIGVALLSVTVVPAMIPTFIKGRLRSEEENWIVRSFIRIYKPVLTWALPRRNLVMWFFAALLILAAGIFPFQALLGQGASQTSWQHLFLFIFAVVTFLTVFLIRGLHWQALAFASLVMLGLWAYHFPKIGVAFMPPLDEGSILDMPVTVPRVSLTQAADDLKARDALLRSFPEVESVIGKAGRADTATDPAPLDMVETFVNFRSKDLWPRRVLVFGDAVWQTRAVLCALEDRGYLKAGPRVDARDEIINDVTQKALERFDETMRALALRRYEEVEGALGPRLTRFAVEDVIDRFRHAGSLHWPEETDATKQVDQLVDQLIPEYGRWLAKIPALEDTTRLSREVARRLTEWQALTDPAEAMAVKKNLLPRTVDAVKEFVGIERETFADEVLRSVRSERRRLWRAEVQKINWELFDRGVQAFTWLAMEELAKSAHANGLLNGAPRSKELARFAEEAARAQVGREPDESAFEPFAQLRPALEAPFAKRVLFWPRQSGPKGDLVDDEMHRVLQVPGWSNIFTQPIVNRIEMLSTGVRTDIGVKVFGPDLTTIDRICKDIEAALKPVNGARDVLAAPVMGKGYLEINIDREKAARYGISVADIQDTIEVALGGRLATQTVEGRERFPVRIRYARAEREDEEAVRRLLVSGGARSERPLMGNLANAMPTPAGAAVSTTLLSASSSHQAAPEHGAGGRLPMQVPLGAVADVRITEGPAMIKSENGRLVNYVTLMVRGRDIVGFVEEARRIVSEKVPLPEGVTIAWSGEFEHQIRAARTLRFVLPAVVILIFLILYLTYNDLADAGLMMLAVPEALAGGAFFQFLFPKIMHGWDAPPLDFTVAVQVGYIACLGMATETSIIMLVYLREAIEKRGGLGKIQSLEALREAVIEGAVHRLRPKLLTEGVAIIALAPMLWATGVGAEVIAPMAVPVLGGLLISDEVVDLFLPVRFYWIRRSRWLKLHPDATTREKVEISAQVRPELTAVT
ncbi:MAG TPA: efflux RND transporter permease subunit [Gemmataceae bacterium]|nr:efflux RND transporter permease subunit [Gemmataceae bacterium]